jgi:DNA segregation ATPase FtsK/SpoIIIE, S-DNA-T family
MTGYLVAVWWLAVSLVAVRLAVAVVRFVQLPPSGRRYWLPARWHRFRWRWLAANLSLSYLDRHRKAVPKIPFGTSVRIPSPDPAVPVKLRFPRARFRPDEYGFVARIKTVPKVGRAEFEKAAPYIADSWRCVRVSIAQPKPGRLVLRGMRRDPLAEPLPADSLPAFDGRRLYLGRDEWGTDRSVSLANLAGSVIGGNPGRGKSQCATSFAVQLAPVLTSEWYVLDGGGGADWECWANRAARFATDDLAEARDVLEDAHAGMVKRLATLTADLGTRNAWTIGPTPDYRLRWIPIDESSVYLDQDRAKALGREAEAHVRAIRSLVMGMMRRGRKVLYHVTLMAQKATSTSVPPDIRDLAGLRLCFGVATTESAIAVLGDDVRAYPSLSPVQLQEDEHTGVCTARLKTGSDPYTRIRVPFVGEDQADEVARQTSHPVPVLRSVG